MAVLSLLSSSLNVTAPSGMWEPLLLLFSFITNYGWRVILFTVLLKLVLSPLDFFQRYKMKKNQRISEKLAPEVEKLKKQYANDPRAMQQEQMRLQRSMGFSYIASCLPMIITLVVFFTFYAGMRNISQYEEFKQYVELYERYSIEYTELTGLEMTGDGTTVEGYDDSVFGEKITVWADENGVVLRGETNNDIAYTQYVEEFDESFADMYAQTMGLRGYLKFFSENHVVPADSDLYSSGQALDSLTRNGHFAIDLVATAVPSNTLLEEDIILAKQEIFDELSAVIGDYELERTAYTNFDQIAEDYELLGDEELLTKNITTLLTVADEIAADAAYQYFIENNQSFLWIKSLWVADVPTKKAIQGFGAFRSNVSKYLNMDSNSGKLPSEILADLNSETTYNKVMLKIRQDSSLSGTNGYFILAIISVGLAGLSQFITTRQQKKSGQVMAGAGSGTMKAMMFIMPIMVGIFAITSTSAFALYMITNSGMSLLINLACTAVINAIFRRKSQAELSGSGVIKYGRRDPNDFVDKK